MGFYEQMMNDPRFLQMMKQRESMSVPNYNLSTPSLTPNSLQNINSSAPAAPALNANPATAASPIAATGGSNLLGYAGLGASAASPILTALLGKGAPEPPRAPPAASLGSKPIMQVDPDIYPQLQRMPAFLARLLMGAR